MDISEQITTLGYVTEVSTPKADSDGLVALDGLTVTVLREHGEYQARKPPSGATPGVTPAMCSQPKMALPSTRITCRVTS
jgi:hypothetical protein